MDNNLLEFLKFAAPSLASAAACYFAARERIRVLEVKLENLATVVEELREDMRDFQRNPRMDRRGLPHESR